MRARGLTVREVQAPPAQLLALATTRPDLFPVLFDSAVEGALGRFSVLAAMPQAQLLLRGDGRLEQRGVALQAPRFLDALDEWWAAEDPAAEEQVADAGPLPFRGGWVIYLGYELAAQIESCLTLPALPPAALCALALRVPAALVHDHQTRRSWLVTEGRAAPLQAPILQALKAVQNLQTLRAPPDALATDAPPSAGVLQEQDPARFRIAVERAQRHIAQGDVYQANLSRGWCLAVTGSTQPGAWYQRLREANPAPFAAFASLPGLQLLCSSPERLVSVRAGCVETRPIAGTRARRGTVASDGVETQELLANPKERAEHVMLLDLERNDLGRICRAGSVQVSEFMVTESYPHLHHIVSNVRGQLRAQVTPAAVLRAVFPGGTITGCPKIRCMQLIGELEGEPRGPYTGSLGYLNRNGDMDFNILIRTASLSAGALDFRTGAGIVADSDWQRELDETRAKAAGMLRAFTPPGERAS